MPSFSSAAGDEDRADVAGAEPDELEVRAQEPERLGGVVLGLDDHRELVALLHRAGRRRQAGEERQPAESFRELAGRADARVERLESEDDPETEDQAEDQPECSVALRVGRDLGAGSGGPDDDRARGLQRLECLQLLVFLFEVGVERRVLAALGLERRHQGLDLGAGLDDRFRLEAVAVVRERFRVGGREEL